MTAQLLDLNGHTFSDANVTVIGRARHGKDSVANMLRVLDDSFERIALADELKNHLANLLATSVERLDLNRGRFKSQTLTPDYFLAEFKNNKDKYRPLLQWFGTEFVRDFDDQFWIKTLNSQTFRRGVRTVLTDARFPNEIASRQEFGDFIIKVVRPDMMIAESGHASEAQIDSLPYHILIRNDGNIEDLFAQVKVVYDGYLAKKAS